MIFLAASTALAGCSTVPANEPLVAPVAAAPAEPVVAAAPAAEARAWRPSASTPPAWIRRSCRAIISSNSPTAPGPRPRRSPPTSPTMACSPCSTICRATARAALIEEAAKDPEQPHRRGLCQLHGRSRARGEGPGRRSTRGSSKIRGAQARLPSFRKIYAAASRLGVGTPFGGFVGQDDKAARPIYPVDVPGRASACPTATIICRSRRQAGRDPGQIPRPSDQHADARR